MNQYDAIIIGAGPAGGQCARELSHKGRKVFLAEKAKSFSENNYSSGGAPIEIMEDFKLPSSVVGTYWNRLSVQSTNTRTLWDSPYPFGPVIEFDKLRSFLIKDLRKNGGQFQLGCQYLAHEVSDKFIQVYLKDLNTREEFQLQTKVLVDATGSDRKVLMKHYNKHQSLAATGIEYHIRVSPASYEQFQHSLNFFLGHKWMPQGYAWIFPMAPYQLKVGVIRYFQNHSYISYDPSYAPYLKRMLSLCGNPHTIQVLDKHGKTIHYTFGQKDYRHQGPVLAIGDAISSINPLGCEGIRHALVSGRYAAIEVDKFLNKEVSNFNGFDKSMNRYFGFKWFLSEKFISQLFKNPKDSSIDKIVHSFGLMNNKQIIDVIFNYRFQRTLRPYFWYFASYLKDVMNPK